MTPPIQAMNHAHGRKLYLELLIKLSDSITTSDLRDLKYLCDIPAKTSETITTSLELFKHFEHEGELSAENITVLHDLFDTINRRDLISKLHEYENKCKQICTTKEESKRKADTQKKGPTVTKAPKKQSQSNSKPNYKLLTPLHFSRPSLKKKAYESSDEDLLTPTSESSGSSISQSTSASISQSTSANIIQGSNGSISQSYEDEFSSAYICTESDTPIEEEFSGLKISINSLPQEILNTTVAFALPGAEVDKYKMNSIPRGKCIIVSNEDFSLARKEGINISDRPGSKKDKENLEKTFEYLEFDVVVHTDLAGAEMWAAIDNMSRLNHSDFDCFVCCILSHGSFDGLYGIDGKPVKVYNIVSGFNGFATPTLSGKPKLFFFQACRGNTSDIGAMRKDDPFESANLFAEIEKFKGPTESDYFIGYATPPGYAAWIHEKDGSWYINALCESLCTLASSNYDIHAICTYVNQKVSKQYTDNGCRQMPNPSHTLTKLLYFFPEKEETEEF